MAAASSTDGLHLDSCLEEPQPASEDELKQVPDLGFIELQSAGKDQLLVHKLTDQKILLPSSSTGPWTLHFGDGHYSFLSRANGDLEWSRKFLTKFVFMGSGKWWIKEGQSFSQCLNSGDIKTKITYIKIEGISVSDRTATIKLREDNIFATGCIMWWELRDLQSCFKSSSQHRSSCRWPQ